MRGLRLVYSNPSYILLGIIAFVLTAFFYLWTSQVLTIQAHGIAWLIEPDFIATALIMAVLFGLVLPLQIHALRLAIASSPQTGGTVLGVLLGTASMTCCTPVILPSILSLLGFSGTTILGLNTVAHRYWLPLATLGIILLLYSLFSVIQSLDLECEIGAFSADGDTAVAPAPKAK